MNRITFAGTLGVLLFATTARADTPSAEELEAAVTAFAQIAPAAEADDADADLVAAAAMISPPLTYAGFKYDRGDGMAPSTAAKACRKRWGSAGTVKAKELAAFLKCAEIAEWNATFGTWSVEDVRKLPALLVPAKSQLKKLAQTQTLVYMHVDIPAPPDMWTAFAGTKDADGHVRITAIVAGYVWRKNFH